MLTLRASESEGVLRSTGEPPNGIVIVAQPDDHSFAIAISPSMMPEDQIRGINISAEIPEDLSYLEPQEAVDACAGPKEGRVLSSLSSGPILAVLPVWVIVGRFDAVRAAVDFLEEMHEAVCSRDWSA